MAHEEYGLLSIRDAERHLETFAPMRWGSTRQTINAVPVPFSFLRALPWLHMLFDTTMMQVIQGREGLPCLLLNIETLGHLGRLPAGPFFEILDYIRPRSYLGHLPGSCLSRVADMLDNRQLGGWTRRALAFSSHLESSLTEEQRRHLLEGAERICVGYENGSSKSCLRVIALALPHLQSLKILTLNRCPCATDRSAHHLAQGLVLNKSITKLRIRECDNITDAGINILRKACMSLEVSGCKNVSGELDGRKTNCKITGTSLFFKSGLTA